MPCKGCLRRLVGRAATGGFTLLLALPPSLLFNSTAMLRHFNFEKNKIK
jgi:hypothetical protein